MDQRLVVDVGAKYALAAIEPHRVGRRDLAAQGDGASGADQLAPAQVQAIAAVVVLAPDLAGQVDLARAGGDGRLVEFDAPAVGHPAAAGVPAQAAEGHIAAAGADVGVGHMQRDGVARPGGRIALADGQAVPGAGGLVAAAHPDMTAVGGDGGIVDGDRASLGLAVEARPEHHVELAAAGQELAAVGGAGRIDDDVATGRSAQQHVGGASAGVIQAGAGGAAAPIDVAAVLGNHRHIARGGDVAAHGDAATVQGQRLVGDHWTQQSQIRGVGVFAKGQGVGRHGDAGQAGGRIEAVGDRGQRDIACGTDRRTRAKVDGIGQHRDIGGAAGHAHGHAVDRRGARAAKTSDVGGAHKNDISACRASTITRD